MCRSNQSLDNILVEGLDDIPVESSLLFILAQHVRNQDPPDLLLALFREFLLQHEVEEILLEDEVSQLLNQILASGVQISLGIFLGFLIHGGHADLLDCVEVERFLHKLNKSEVFLSHVLGVGLN